ncbi:ABC transporter substrate-binding protein [Fundidesulfovibrio soli]|uniref:ABC transporter substrate-binding protein n=1 Tax=Fundidesulfovibrio soli TaxID=2922716 RepID=UPI001FAF8212|nr:penicillin-binding protein activator [Fundidesulfovibrio soli]
MFSAGKIAKPLFMLLAVTLFSCVVASAQTAPSDQPEAAPATGAAPKRAKTPPRVLPKPGEVVPLDQAAAPAGAPDQASAPAVSPGAPASPAAKPGKKSAAQAAPAQPAAEPIEAAQAAPAAPAQAPAARTPAKGAKAAPAAAGSASIRPDKLSAMPVRAKGKDTKVSIGALLPLTGAQAAQGQGSKAAIELAVADINAYLAEMGSTDRVSVQIEDTASNPATALERLKALSVAGIRMVVGPYSDNEVDAVLDFATKNGILLLSMGSAGPYLARPGDNLFRFVPTDAYQAEAIAVLASQEGCTQLISIWEGDIYGDEVVTHIKGQFANQGGQIIPGTRFRPEVTTGMASYVADLKAQIDKSVKDKKKLAIVVAANGSHTAAILREAAKVPGLDEAHWYGSDSAALRGAIIQDQDVAKFAAKVRVAFARLGETGTALYSELEKRVEDKVNAFVDTQALVAYDIVWLCTSLGLNAGDDFPALKKALAPTAEHFYGTTGWMAVNENGDRREDYDFDFWTIKFIDGKYYWVKTARYQFDPGSVKQLIINAAEKD